MLNCSSIPRIFLLSLCCLLANVKAAPLTTTLLCSWLEYPIHHLNTTAWAFQNGFIAILKIQISRQSRLEHKVSFRLSQSNLWGLKRLLLGILNIYQYLFQKSKQDEQTVMKDFTWIKANVVVSPRVPSTRESAVPVRGQKSLLVLNIFQHDTSSELWKDAPC